MQFKTIYKGRLIDIRKTYRVKKRIDDSVALDFPRQLIYILAYFK